MLAYTAVDGLRAISRDFDLDWHLVSDDTSAVHRDWRESFRAGQRSGRRAFNMLAALLPIGAIWLR